MIDQDSRGGLLLWIQSQSGPVRTLIFITFIMVVTGLMFSATALLYWLNLNNFPRTQPVAFADIGVTVRELARLEDADAYPAAVAVYEGTAYTGSYATGTIWALSESGTATEISETRDRISSVIGLDVAADGTIYVLDHIDPLAGSGATIWTIHEGTLTQLLAIGPGTLVAPNDIAVDASGNLYITDLGLLRVMRIAAGSTEAVVWWQSDDPAAAPAGLAFDPRHDRLLITDANLGLVYAVPLDAADPNAETDVIYRDRVTRNQPGFNGITAAEDGSIYVAALSLNQIGRIDEEAQQITYIAGAFRGSSDVAYDVHANRLIVNNWDQRWLLPVEFLFLRFQVEPRLPFSIEVIELDAG